MGWSILADGVLVLHGAFIAWATLGALAVWRWPGLLWLHLPALAWGVWIEASAGLCPLTPLEMALRHRAGQETYAGSFIEHWLSRLLYWEAPWWVFVAAYSGFALLVALAWWWVRPLRRPAR